MDIRQLRQFTVVAEELNFRRAAVRLQMAQPPLSQAIKRLENELGVALLTRDRKAVHLTPAGAVFLAEARHTVAQLERSVTMARRAASGEVGNLRVSFMGSATYSCLLQVIQEFRMRHPDVELELIESTSLDIMRQLNSNQIDIGFLRPVIGLSRNLRVETIEIDRFLAALPARHKLANEAAINLRQLESDAFVIFSARRSPTLHQQTLMLCRSVGFTPKIAQEATQVQTVVSLVSAGLGVALVPSAVRRLLHRDVAYVSLRNRSPFMTLELLSARRADNVAPILSAFAALARKMGKANSQLSPRTRGHS
jgi:DNA-binding transcriptional LysR family regulator